MMLKTIISALFIPLLAFGEVSTDSRKTGVNTGEINPSYQFIVYEDFLFTTTAGSNNLTSTVSGTGGAIAMSCDISCAAHPGQAKQSIANNGSRSTMDSLTNAFLPGGGELSFETLIYIDTLATAGEDYQYLIGFNDSRTAFSSTDGIYFSYDRATSANWIRNTCSNGSCTATATSTAVAEDVWIKLKIVINPGGTSVSFYVNGVSVGSNTATIPTAVGREFFFVSFMLKTASSANTAINIYNDYFKIKKVFSTPR